MASWLTNVFKKEIEGAPKFGTMSIHETDLELAKKMLEEAPNESAIVELESAFEKYLKMEDAFAFGQEPIAVVLDVLEDDAMIVAPAFLHKNTVDAFARKGLKVKWVDIEMESFGPDFEELKKTIEAGADALFLPHFLGIPSNHLAEIVELCQANSVWLIEDCRQGLGGLFDSQALGSFGDVALFSFNAMMPINTIQGGLISVKDNVDFAEKIKNHQLNAASNPLAQKELLKIFIDFYKDRKIPDKGLLDVKKDNLYWEEKWTFVSPGKAVKIHPAQAVLAKVQFDQAENFSYYRQNHLKLWQEVSKDHQWQMPVPIMRSAPGWLRAPILIPVCDQDKVKTLKEQSEYSRWYNKGMMTEDIDYELFPNTKRAMEELFVFPTEL